MCGAETFVPVTPAMSFDSHSIQSEKWVNQRGLGCDIMTASWKNVSIVVALVLKGKVTPTVFDKGMTQE
jgi:hypothetical protein